MDTLRRKKDVRKREFEQEALQHLNALYRNALRLTHSSTDAEDLVQETYLKACRFYGRFDAGSNLKAWLFRIQFNSYINKYRRKARERSALSSMSDQYDLGGAISSSTVRQMVDPGGTPMWSVVGMEIEKAINELPDDYRIMVLLADVEEMNYREIAEIVDCPIGTVMSRLYRARQMLQKRLIEHARQLGFIKAEGKEESIEYKASEQTVSLDAYRQNRSSDK